MPMCTDRPQAACGQPEPKKSRTAATTPDDEDEWSCTTESPVRRNRLYHTGSNQLAIRIESVIGTSLRTFYGPIWPKYPSWAQGCSSVSARRRFSSKQQQQQQKTIFWYLDTIISKIESFGVSWYLETDTMIIPTSHQGMNP